MAFCPQCGFEVPADATACAACGGPLSPALTAPNPAPPGEPPTPANEAIADALADDAIMEHDSNTILIIASIAAAFLFVALLVGAWFAYDAFYATPSRALGAFLGAIDEGDDERVLALISDDVARDVDTLDGTGAAHAVEAAFGPPPDTLEFAEESRTGTRATFAADDGDVAVEIRLAKTGYGSWKVDEIRSATVTTEVETVEATNTTYQDTPLLAQGVEVACSGGTPGEARVTYETPLVNGIARDREEVDRRVTVQPGARLTWRGTGPPDDSGVSVYDIQTGTGGISGEPGVSSPAQVMSRDEGEYLVAFQFEPTPAGTTARLYWLTPEGEVVEDELWDPDDSWTWSWVRYALTPDMAEIVPGTWVAAIHINGAPASYATFEIE